MKIQGISTDIIGFYGVSEYFKYLRIFEGILKDINDFEMYIMWKYF